MRDYGKMFLGLILAGIALIMIGLWLISVHPRGNASNQVRQVLSGSPALAAFTAPPVAKIFKNRREPKFVA